MDGFYVLYYTGKEGSGFLSALINKGTIAGVDAAGGIISGKYEKTSLGLELSTTFTFKAGTELVTGQSIDQDVSIPFNLLIETATFSGATQLANFPTGKVNFKM